MKPRPPGWLTSRMLHINCPHCGWRDETEFRFAGPADIKRPQTTAPREWARYLYERANSAGEQDERWLHVSGCGHWLKIRRDTRTNGIVSAVDE
jgi:sarcosine oxidase subunit delta